MGSILKSKKDCIVNHSNPTNLKKLEDMSNIEWLQINFSQAEIHIQALAESMWDVCNESTPKLLQPGEWHVPFGDKMDEHDMFHGLRLGSPELWGIESFREELNSAKIKVATARCAD